MAGQFKKEKSRVTGDGSITFFNSEFKEHYHSLVGAREEALAKYIIPSQFEEQFGDMRGGSENLLFQRDKPVGDSFMEQRDKPAGDTVSVLDVCFGLGYNTLLAIEKAVECGGYLNVTALEIDKNVVRDASQYFDSDWSDILAGLYDNAEYAADNFNIEMMWGDARESCKSLINSGKRRYDLIYHDPFSTQRNAQLWTVDFFRKLSQLLKPGGLVLTYSTAIPVLVGFIEAGFYVGKTEAVGTQRIGTVATKNKELIKYPYHEKELGVIINSVKSIPYRDESQCGDNGQILKERNEKVVRK